MEEMLKMVFSSQSIEHGLICDDTNQSPIKLNATLKRIFDVILAMTGMVVFSPLYLLIYAAIKREDGGSVIFKQQRIGYHGHPFTLYKFRSMKQTSESDGTPLLCKEEDDRLTHIGSFIRSHHLDELPQLWNVVKGDMSFVGYRPERKYFIDKIMEHDSRYSQLYKMRPGVFSMATLYNGYTDTMEKMLTRLEMDLEYLNKHNLWTDIKIVWLTGYSILSGKQF